MTVVKKHMRKTKKGLTTVKKHGRKVRKKMGKYYHGTSKRKAKGILEHGLKPKKDLGPLMRNTSEFSDSEYVYMFKDPQKAEAYANIGASTPESFVNMPGTVVSIDIDDNLVIKDEQMGRKFRGSIGKDKIKLFSEGEYVKDVDGSVVKYFKK